MSPALGELPQWQDRGKTDAYPQALLGWLYLTPENDQVRTSSKYRIKLLTN